MGEKTLTASDRLALSRMPDGWFGLYDLPPVIHNSAYRCQRLVERGLLEWEVVGELPHNLESRWRKTQTKEAKGDPMEHLREAARELSGDDGLDRRGKANGSQN